MAFDADCVIEQGTGLPVCSVDYGDVVMLHSMIAMVVAYMEDHHIPRDEWDAPYVFREYIPEKVTANDVAALSRIGAAAVARGIDLPPLLAPLYAGQDAPVAGEDVEYVAVNARDLAELLGPVLTNMRAADVQPARFPWGWIVVVAVGGVVLGAALAANVGSQEKRNKRAQKQA